MEYYSAIKKNEILPFAAKWMDLEGIVLNKSDRERQISCDLACTLNLERKEKQTHRYREEQTGGCQRRGWGGQNG